MTLPDFLCSDEYGEIFVTGHRITLYHVIKDYKDGCSVEVLAATYPTLSLAQLHKVIAYYLDNQTDVDAYVAETLQEIENQSRAAPLGPSLAELKHRLHVRRQSESA